MSENKATRLNKRLVELGLAPSRRAGDELIASGQVKINGQSVSTLATTVQPDDIIRVGRASGHERSHITIALNKPVGYVCTHQAQGQQKTIFSLLPKNFDRLKYAGRLDKDSQGLLILTSDGELVQSLTHPGRGKDKEYIVSIDQPLTPADLGKLERGIRLDGKLARFKSIKRINATTFRITLNTGLNRQIRRSFAHINKEVTKLERVRIGKYSLGTLRSGRYIFVKPEDIK